MSRKRINIGTGDWTRILEGRFKPGTIGRYFPKDFLGIPALSKGIRPGYSQTLGCYWNVIGIGDLVVDFELPKDQHPSAKAVVRTALALNPNAKRVSVYVEGVRILYAKGSGFSWFEAS